MNVQAVLLAGDRGHARAVKGRSKGFVDVGGKPMIVHVLEALLHTPEVSEVFIVGDAIRIEKAMADYSCLQLAAARSRPVHVIPQRDTLYENIWHAFLRTLPPGTLESQDDRHPILVVPTDIPVVVPEELSEFVERAEASGADHVIGLTPEVALLPFGASDDSPGIEMACFNLTEGRYRQSNLNYVRPLRIGNRHYIQDLYENRYQQEFGSTLGLGMRILRKEFRNLWVLFPYLVMHLAGVLDRRGYRRLSDRVRSWVSLRTVERGLGAMLRTELVFIETALGGAALDVDNDSNLEVADKMIERWKAMQIRMVRAAKLQPDA